MTTTWQRAIVTCAACMAIGACGDVAPSVSTNYPDISARGGAVQGSVLTLSSDSVPAMYRTLLPIDLPTVLDVTIADNAEIQLARQRVSGREGNYESAIGGAFPAIVPTALFRRIDGRNPNSNGDLFSVGFNTFQPSVAIEWVINPGKVYYEIIASKKRLVASRDQEIAVRQEVLRRAANEYYSLVLGQARIEAARQSLKESEELLRITRIRTQAGAGIAADELRAEARLAERQQDLSSALNQFYNVSLALMTTLQLDDPTATLVPSIRELPSRTLVRQDIPIENLLEYAMRYRPDLAGARALVDAAIADRKSALWGNWGPQFEVSYEYGGITGHANNIDRGNGLPGTLIVNPLSTTGAFSPNPVANAAIREGIRRGSQKLDPDRDVTFKFSQRTQFDALVGARWSVAAFGILKAASAGRDRATIEADQAFVVAKAQVVGAAQDVVTHLQLMEAATRQVHAADEALRLTQANLSAGTMTTADVLQAQDAVAKARLSRARAIVGYNQSQVNLVAGIGMLTVESLALP